MADRRPDTLALIAAAYRDHDGLRFGYRSDRATSSRRSVEPHTLVHTGRRWYLVAWTPDRDWRTYRFDRIEPEISLGHRFEPRDPPDGDVQADVSRSISTSPTHTTPECSSTSHWPWSPNASRPPSPRSKRSTSKRA